MHEDKIIRKNFSFNDTYFTLVMNKNLEKLMKPDTLNEYLEMGFASRSNNNLKIFSTVLDRKVKATYNLFDRQIKLENTSILF